MIDTKHQYLHNFALLSVIVNNINNTTNNNNTNSNNELNMLHKMYKSKQSLELTLFAICTVLACFVQICQT